MSDEYINENETLEGSETSENNVISEPESQQDLSSDVPQEDDVRKFQSMYDKAQAELDKVKPVAKLFQDNPELVDVVRNHLTGGKGQDKEIKINEEEFNPWDAYTNPNSKSYALRQQEIDDAVSSRMSDYMGRLEAQRQVDSLRMRAQSEFKLSNNDAEEFVEFVTKPKDQLPLDTLFNVWNTNKNGLPQLNQNIESVKRTQQRPKSAGLVQGGQPPKKSDEDNMWSNIMKAGNPNSIRGNIKK
jgi:hypothetical protein|tara:strand:- start:2500 stop:3231 length:732 start_codon:yes stop_codon:yes gene_type:complete